MTEGAITELTPQAIENVLRDELAQGDLAIATARPILRHLLTNDDEALFSDEVIVRIRGMMRDIARQLLEAQAEAAGFADRRALADERADELAGLLFEDAPFLAHAHALALEGQLLERLRARSGVDPVLTPLVQELAAGANAAVASLAITVLAAQARFLQHHRRLEMPLRDLPGDLFHRALTLLRDHPGEHGEAAATAERRLRSEYEEGSIRVALLARLVMNLDGRAERALAIDHAGLSIFATALALASHQERDVVLVSLAGRQFARLALALRAADLSDDAVAAQLLYVHPDVTLPDGFGLLRADTAAALLAAASPEAAH